MADDNLEEKTLEKKTKTKEIEKTGNLAVVTNDGTLAVVTEEEWSDYANTGKLPDRELTKL